MQLETLKKWEKEHPELAELFPIIIDDIDRVCKEETRKAFKAIDTRLQAEIGADCDKMGVSPEDKKIIFEALVDYAKQVDKDGHKLIAEAFDKNISYKIFNLPN